ncbi:hypothetical protein CEP54_013156 [Fusarium duplospermum]|uniref:Uncharacterized protein n=1 Tax=Fusarium duplospermum TaxID=1325734 RepID=A0A428P4H5_9HYPO|nr:hypothetical protein CEP54_013156 [Fusarium duplospermum]
MPAHSRLGILDRLVISLLIGGSIIISSGPRLQPDPFLVLVSQTCFLLSPTPAFYLASPSLPAHLLLIAIYQPPQFFPSHAVPPSWMH